MVDRELDLVLFGATGFTGRLVAEYLATHAPPALRWGLAGRDERKLAGVRDQLAATHAAARELPLFRVDSADQPSLDRMAASTRVVCTTVGPYLQHGLPLAGACARAGTHTCDLTGEVPFVRRSIDAFHDIAVERGARIVHCCGYDSIPSDLGTLLVQEAMTAQGGPAQRVTTVVGPTRGGFSGGTTASMVGLLEAAEDRAVRRLLTMSHALDPTPHRDGDRDQAAPRWRDDIRQWTAPFLMAPVNTRVVRRSHALLGRPWGDAFVYDETMATGHGLKGRVTATAITAALGAFVALGGRATTRSLLTRAILPSPGDGPDEGTRERGFFRHLLLAVGDGQRLLGRVIGHKDPGYGATAIMLGETALALATDEDALPDAAGVLTPATALGLPLIERLRKAGMTWQVEPWPEDDAPRP